MKDKNGNKMVAYNAYMADDVGVIWCMVVENEAGYRPMIGSNPMQAPWYLAHFEHFIDEQGKIDYKAANESADEIAEQWNSENGYTSEEALEIVTSSMAAQFTMSDDEAIDLAHEAEQSRREYMGRHEDLIE